MKKTLAFVLSLCLLLALTACGGAASSAAVPESEPTAPQSEAAASAPSLPAEAESAAGTEEVPALVQALIDGYEGTPASTPDFLNATQQAQYQAAYIMTIEMSGLGFSLVDYSVEPEIDSTGNFELCTRILTSWDDLMEVTGFIFTPELFDELNATGTEYPMFREEDGKLYRSTGARGSHMEYTGEPDTFELTEESDSAIRFDLIGHYASWETEEPYTESYPIEMVKTDDGWRFSQFAIAF